jgi:hypothetical protein
MDMHQAVVLKDGETRTLTFSVEHFTPEQVKAWLKEQGFKLLKLIPAEIGAAASKKAGKIKE